ncbi:MAG: secondary thiamine-phosphate synthase [Salinivirgaceae bacterium]|nr:MAG: secondary thiamine-phosphate synthase [Salinivirgaceae bacterium]
MITRREITLRSHGRGFHLVTRQIEQALDNLPDEGLLHLFLRHTSAGLTINENADPSVRDDFETFFNDLVPESYRKFTHTMEGSDDMPAHIKASLVGFEVTIPILNGRLDMGTWQGIYLCEFRNHGGNRRVTATIYS